MHWSQHKPHTATQLPHLVCLRLFTQAVNTALTYVITQVSPIPLNKLLVLCRQLNSTTGVRLMTKRIITLHTIMMSWNTTQGEVLQVAYDLHTTIHPHTTSRTTSHTASLGSFYQTTTYALAAHRTGTPPSLPSHPCFIFHSMPAMRVTRTWTCCCGGPCLS